MRKLKFAAVLWIIAARGALADTFVAYHDAGQTPYAYISWGYVGNYYGEGEFFGQPGHIVWVRWTLYEDIIVDGSHQGQVLASAEGYARPSAVKVKRGPTTEVTFDFDSAALTNATIVGNPGVWTGTYHVLGVDQLFTGSEKGVSTYECQTEDPNPVPASCTDVGLSAGRIIVAAPPNILFVGTMAGFGIDDQVHQTGLINLSAGNYRVVTTVQPQ